MVDGEAVLGRYVLTERDGSCDPSRQGGPFPTRRQARGGCPA